MNPKYALVLVPVAVLTFSGVLTAHAADAVSACPPDGANTASCGALVSQDSLTTPYAIPVGFSPAALLKAYNLPAKPVLAPGKPPVVAVIGAYDAPKMAADLATYSKTFGITSLPDCAGAVKDSPVPCFQKVDQNGGQNFSRKTDWHLGIEMEVEAVHAICQNCSILLVESKNSYGDNLLAATDEAVALGARYIDTAYEWISPETQDVYNAFDPHFTTPGVAFVAPEGEGGYGEFNFPAASKYVTAVGATTLSVKSDGSYKNEALWSPSTSYCDQLEAKPVWQTDPKCADRMGADLAMDGDISTGIAMYDSTDNGKKNGWYLAGGTALSSSLVTGVFALANHHQADMAALPYENYSLSNFHDITQGSNGTCDTGYFCNAKKGYDGPTGLGSPNGLGGF